MPTDLDHHIVRGTLYPAHGFDTEVRLGQEFWGKEGSGTTPSSLGLCAHKGISHACYTAFETVMHTCYRLLLRTLS